MPCLHLLCCHRQHEGARPVRGPERGLHGLPPRGKPRREGRHGGQVPLRRRVCQGVDGQSHELQVCIPLLQPGPPRQHPRGGGLGGHRGAGDELLPLRHAVRRPGSRAERQFLAVQVQRQGAGQDARAGHLRLRRTAVRPCHRTLGQGGPAVREIL